MSSLNKYSGVWTKYEAAHLLRRTTYGANIDTIKLYGSKSLDQCIDIIFQPIGPPPPPINLTSDTDPDVPIGETWVDKGTSTGVNGYRYASLRSWMYDYMIGYSPNIREKMTMFWHNHFVTADINDPRYTYKYISLLRDNALGNFKQLTKDVAIDISMLVYLNGNQNTKQAPNENFARELMELFTLGKGALAGPGDYTTYTEEDVKELAKAFTGWMDVRATLPLRAQFVQNRHDTSTKKLSARFGSVTIPNADAEEYKNVIDIIFQREEVSLFISRKMYKWFVQSKIDSDIETNVIVPMAKMIRDTNFEIAPALKALLSSEHFYDACVIGAIIKNPIDFLLNPINHFEVAMPTDAVMKLQVNGRFFLLSNQMQMGIFLAPSVAGWQAYYQEPSYYRLWLNASSLPARRGYTDGLTNGFTVSNYKVLIDPLRTIDKFDSPEIASKVIEEMALLLFPKPVASVQMVELERVLLDGGTAANWTTIYNAYKADPTNTTKRNVVVVKAKKLIAYMLGMPEFHLS